MIRIIYHDSTEHPCTMTITQTQENSELVITQSITLNDIQHTTLISILAAALGRIPSSDAEDDGYGGATYIWVFD